MPAFLSLMEVRGRLGSSCRGTPLWGPINWAGTGACPYTVDKQSQICLFQRRVELVRLLRASGSQRIVVCRVSFSAEEKFGEPLRVLDGKKAGIIISQEAPGARYVGPYDGNAAYNGFGYHIGATLIE